MTDLQRNRSASFWNEAPEPGQERQYLELALVQQARQVFFPPLPSALSSKRRPFLHHPPFTSPEGTGLFQRGRRTTVGHQNRPDPRTSARLGGFFLAAKGSHLPGSRGRGLPCLSDPGRVSQTPGRAVGGRAARSPAAQCYRALRPALSGSRLWANIALRAL